MDLKDFTKQTLIQIVEGAAEANEVLGKHNAFIPDTNIYNKDECYYAVDKEKIKRKIVTVDFDVAITATESEEANGGASLKVASLLCLGGGTENRTENQTISRIKYTLPLVLAKK